MLKLNHLVDAWNLQLELVPLKNFAGETISPNIVAGHDILLFVITKK